MDAVTCYRGKRNAEQRIKQLINNQRIERQAFIEQIDYLKRVYISFLPYIPKNHVNRLLEAAKESNGRSEQCAN
ncbi:MAG TPA: hypothetical protein VHB45_07550 [Alloacidobacterium sp.]|nr:hypothetical protein [Alloacidobacterium sp.]